MAHELPLRMAESKVNQLKAEADKLRAEAEKLAAERPPPVTVAPVVHQSGSEQPPRPIIDKRAVIPRPSVDEGITESDWSFFAAQWGRYKSSTALSGVPRHSTCGRRARTHYNGLFTTRVRGRWSTRRS